MAEATVPERAALVIFINSFRTFRIAGIKYIGNINTFCIELLYSIPGAGCNPDDFMFTATKPAPKTDRTVGAAGRVVMGLLLASGLAACGGSAGGGAQDAAEHWVATWTASMVDSQASISDVTNRLMIHVAVGGPTVRLRFSNRYGAEPLRLRNVNIALPVALKLPAVDADTVRPVLFGGSAEVLIPAGQEMRSDPVAFDLPADSDVAVTFYTPDTVSNVTAKSNSLTTSWHNGNTGGGDATADAMGLTMIVFDAAVKFLDSVEVVAPGNVTTVVALGDSITDGGFEIPNSDGRWPDLLNDRIAASDLAGLRSVVNAGISGNMVTADRDGNAVQGQAAITRMAWDVFELPNVSHLIVYEGINDIGEYVTAQDIIAGLQTITDEAHRRGIKVVAATLTPCFGASATDFFSYTLNESQRYPVNDWILHSGVPDATIDFNAAVSTGLTPETWLPHLTVDYLHPNPLGLYVMADAIPLDVLR